MAAKLPFFYNEKDSNIVTTENLTLIADPETEKKKALIVDDETDICYLLSHILKQRNIQTVFAGSLAEADRLLHCAGYFYYLFLDNHLPDGRGIDQIKRWKQRFPLTHVIMISAQDSYEEKTKATSDGADSFISKPFSKEVIFNSIVPAP